MPNTTNEICTYHDFAHMLPTPVSRLRLLRLSDTGRFAAYVRPKGLYSEPVFAKKKVIDWVKANYAELLPDHVAAFEKELMKKTNQTPRTRRKRESV